MSEHADASAQTVQGHGAGTGAPAVVLSHGLEPNMVHLWLREERQRAAPERMQGTASAFVPVHVGADAEVSHYWLMCRRLREPRERLFHPRARVARVLNKWRSRRSARWLTSVSAATQSIFELDYPER